MSDLLVLSMFNFDHHNDIIYIFYHYLIVFGIYIFFNLFNIPSCWFFFTMLDLFLFSYGEDVYSTYIDFLFLLLH